MTRGMDLSGFANFDGTKRGPAGERLCRVCGKAIPEKSVAGFCSEGCIESFRIQTDTEYARKKVFERDRGVCKLCGLDTEAVMSEKTAAHMACGVGPRDAQTRALKEILAVWGYPNLRRRVLWDMDHIVAVALGGTNVMDNLRTLCMPCHKMQTKNLMKHLQGSPILKRSRQPKRLR